MRLLLVPIIVERRAAKGRRVPLCAKIRIVSIMDKRSSEAKIARTGWLRMEPKSFARIPIAPMVGFVTELAG